jgi:glycosyltransferase involved in cell wall biosynthesis
VRRGTERNIEELAKYLIRRGHEVITVSTRPDDKPVEVSGAGRRILQGSFWTPMLGWIRISPMHTFFFPALMSLRSLQPDVVHSFFFSDALAASCARRSQRYRTVFQMNGAGIPGVSCHRWWPPEGWLLYQAMTRADARVACSRFVAELYREHYGVHWQVIPPPVDAEAFPFGHGPSNGRPTILSVGDFTVPRKGVRVLVQAFQLVKSKIPEAVLRLSGRMPEKLQAQVLRDVPESVRRDIQVLGLGLVEDVPRLYREANVMALAAMWEPSGTVMVEAWSSGTPVVATNHAGLPEFMGEGVGVLFEPKTNEQETRNAHGLAEAILQGLEISQHEGVRERCRAHAGRFSMGQLGPQIEKLYAAP